MLCMLLPLLLAKRKPSGSEPQRPVPCIGFRIRDPLSADWVAAFWMENGMLPAR